MTDSLHKNLDSGVFRNKERRYFNVLCSYLCHLSPFTCYCVADAWHAGELCPVEFVKENLALGQGLIRVFLCFIPLYQSIWSSFIRLSSPWCTKVHYTSCLPPDFVCPTQIIHKLRYAIICDITQRLVMLHYQHFVTTHRSDLQGSSFFLDSWPLKMVTIGYTGVLISP